MDYMRTVLYLLGGSIILFTLIPLIRSDHWSFRIFEFPRAQKLAICFILLLAFVFYFRFNSLESILFTAALFIDLCYLLYQVLPFTPVAPKQMEDTSNQLPGQFLSIMVSNVYQFNRRADKLLRVVKKNEPDVLLLVETDEWWKDAVSELEKLYPNHELYPQDNTYGMLLYSRLPLEETEIKFLVEDYIPSIHTKVVLRSGDRVKLFCIHPEPPAPNESIRTTERNAEILKVAKMAKECDLPAVVCGDLNDVAWSYTTELFLKTSGMLDPRRGRGLYNSFHAKHVFLRWPLDHFFCSKEFRLIKLRRLEHINSDHFPMLIKISLEPSATYTQDGMELDSEEKEEVDEKIEKAE